MLARIGSRWLLGISGGYLAGTGSNGGVDLSDPLTYLIGYGPLGIFAVLLVMGKIHPDKIVRVFEQQLARREEVIKTKDELIKQMTDTWQKEAIPALTRATDAITLFAEREDKTSEALNQVSLKLEHLSGRLGAT